VADGTLGQRLDLMATYQDQGVFMLDWTEAGIALAPTCLACGGRISGFYERWNPETGPASFTMRTHRLACGLR
jgi:hypothetical protein